MKVRKLKKIIKTSLVVLFALALAAVSFNTWHIFFYNKLDSKPYTYKYINVPSINFALTKKESRELVNGIYNTHYIYKTKNINSDKNVGYSKIMFRIIVLDENLTGQEYIIHFAHELTHVYYQAGNETWVTFMTFKNLYESENEILHNSGLLYAKWICEGGYEGKDYDCSYYVIEYLNSHAV